MHASDIAASGPAAYSKPRLEAASPRHSEKVIYYQIYATLVDLQSNEKVWTGQKQTKKYIQKPRFRG